MTIEELIQKRDNAKTNALLQRRRIKAGKTKVRSMPEDWEEIAMKYDKEIKALENDIPNRRVESICVIAKLDNGKYHQIMTKTVHRDIYLNLIAQLTPSGAIEISETELEGLEF